MQLSTEPELGQQPSVQPPVGDQLGPTNTAPTGGVEPRAHMCPRQRWFSWNNDHQQDHQHQQHHHDHHHPMWRHWSHSHHRGPQDAEGLKEWDKNRPPRDWQEWRELRKNGHGPWRHSRFNKAAEPRPILDDSRWLEDFFAWY